MKLAHRNKIKVLLDGQGSDESLAGYMGYFGLYFANLMVHAHFLKLKNEMKNYKRLHGSKYPIMDIVYPMVPGFIKKYKRRKNAYFVDQDFLNKYTGTEQYIELMRLKPLSEKLKQSIKYQLLNLLKFEDKISMAFSIETRLPFLDYRLINFLFTLPDNFKLRDGKTKYIFREAIKDLVPTEIYNRHDKVGFEAPEERWLKNDKVWKFISKLLTSPKTIERGIVTKEGINRLLNDYKTGQNQDRYIIWSLVVLELWFRIYFDYGFNNFKFKGTVTEI
jgi:asparagine synthase (glutamine-hydrolysing)